MKNTRNKISVLYKFFRITDYQELKIIDIEKGKQYTQNMYSSNHSYFIRGILSKCIKDTNKMVREVNEKFSKYMDIKREFLGR